MAGRAAVSFDELRRLVYAADASALFVSSRILRRLVQAEFREQGIFSQSPRIHSLCIDRHVLFRHVDEDELQLEPDRLLPTKVLLLRRPNPDVLTAQSRDETLQQFWSLLFHGQIQQLLDDRISNDELTAADISQRTAAIGESQFHEIRAVLRNEQLVWRNENDTEVYKQFVAVWLELKYFRSNLRATYFPSIGDPEQIDRLVLQDAAADAIFDRTRLGDAANPVIRTDMRSDETHDFYWKCVRSAHREREEGDHVSAAIQHTKAMRVAPSDLADTTRVEALGDLHELTLRLQAALKFTPDEASQWMQVLPELLDKADQGEFPVEARLLYDLQLVCVDNERKLFSWDAIDWITSAGHRPLKRPLSGVPLVQTVKHLQRAINRLPMARVTDADRQQLLRLMQLAQHNGEQRLRDRFLPILRDAFEDVGLRGANPPEKAAQRKMIEELLDRIIEAGFITFSDLRDAISRNQLKMADMSDPMSFWRGDALIRLDRRFSSLMEGVYQRGAFYLRVLERIGSVAFGTGLGRFLSRDVALPFGGAYALLATSELALRHEFKLNWQLYPKYSCWVLGLFFLLTLRVKAVRRALAQVGWLVWRGIRGLVYDLPVRVLSAPTLKRVITSWPCVLAYWFIIKPGVVMLILHRLWPGAFVLDGNIQWSRAAIIWAALAAIINSRVGFLISETVWELVVRATHRVSVEVVGSLIHLVILFFKRISNGLEHLLYMVNEWLHFKGGDTRLMTIMRALASVVWAPIAFLIRLFFTIVIEPNINPIKLVISTIAAKVLLLVASPLGKAMTVAMTPMLGVWLAGSISGLIFFWVLPGFCAFLIWEIQENWKLFRANRPQRLQPVGVGQHGESMLQLLRPGFHSGVVPKLYHRLRQAERHAYRTSSWRQARTIRMSLDDVAQDIRRFLDREFLELIRQSQTLGSAKITIGSVRLAFRSIHVSIEHPEHPARPARLVFEENAGWLVGSLSDPGWITKQSLEGQRIMTAAVAGLFKVAGVHFIKQQLDAILEPHVHQLTPTELIVRDGVGTPPATVDLSSLEEPDQLIAPHPQIPGAGRLPIPAQRLAFFLAPLTWGRWVDYWRKDQDRQPLDAAILDGFSLFDSPPSHRPPPLSPDPA